MIRGLQAAGDVVRAMDGGGIPAVRLNDGTDIPALTLGVMHIDEDGTGDVVRQAAGMGYRAFDTSPVYRNEEAVGQAVRSLPGERDDYLIATKLWNDFHGYDSALRAFDDSLRRTGLDRIDLYLIHWPVPARGLFVDTWKALVRLKQDGRVRSIGVSNFLPDHLRAIADATGEALVLNQVELHPYWQQAELRAVHAEMGIATQAWSPLARGEVLNDPALTRMAQARGCTTAALVLRFLTQEGAIVCAKAGDPAHMRDNLQSFGFTLEEEELAQIRALHRTDGRHGPDPLAFAVLPREVVLG